MSTLNPPPRPSGAPEPLPLCAGRPVRRDASQGTPKVDGSPPFRAPQTQEASHRCVYRPPIRSIPNAEEPPTATEDTPPMAGRPSGATGPGRPREKPSSTVAQAFPERPVCIDWRRVDGPPYLPHSSERRGRGHRPGP